MQLLVSVADAEEAADALDGGADIVDAKDPASGPLGAVTPDVFRTMAQRIAGVRPLSAALGDPADESDAYRLARAFTEAGAQFVKIGLHAARAAADVRRLLIAAVAGAGPAPSIQGARRGTIAVAYADQENAALTRWQLIDAASSAGATGILLDTCDKNGPGLLTLLPRPALHSWIQDAARAGLLVAIAGRLSHDDVMRVQDSEADIIGVRGAVCVGGRTGRVSAEQVRRLKALCAAQSAWRRAPDENACHTTRP
jgi:uncharacterized protein (UPF0264 family)